MAGRRIFQENTDMGETLTLTTADGASISAYQATPTGTPKGGIVVLQEIFGVNAHIRSVADRFAAAGYLAVAPALFDRVEPGVELGYDGEGMGRGMALMKQTSQDKALQDVAAAVGVAAKAGPVGVVGFCWGGTLAYAAATHLDTLAAAVGYYGGGIAGIVAEKLHCPVELHFGEKDDHIPMPDIEKIRHAHPGMPVYTYPAGHGFNCDMRGSYDKASADLAWTRTLEFFGRHVK
jgi:carboxymethylenebutenolidase